MNLKVGLSNKMGHGGKKVFAILFALIMVLSVSLIITYGTGQAYGASGSVSFNPTVFSNQETARVIANGGQFTSGSTLNFYLSSTGTFSSSSTYVGTRILPNGATSFTNTLVNISVPATKAPGNYYLAASENGGTSFTSGTAVTVTALKPSITLSPSTIVSGGTTNVTGNEFDPGATVNIYLTNAGGQILASNIAASTGYFTAKITIPNTLPQNSLSDYIVAEEVSTGSPNHGITASTPFALTASIVVSPSDIAPSTANSIVINGYGFQSGATISSSAVSLSGGITSVSNVATSTNSIGQFSTTVTFNSVSASGPITVTVSTSPSSTPTNFQSAFFVSQENATKLGFTFAVTPTTGSTYNVGDVFTADVYNFPSSQSVNIYLGSASIGTIATDGNGYGKLTSTIPALPGNTYTPTAVVNSMNLHEQSSNPLTIAAYYSVKNPSGGMFATGSSEYIPSSAILTISAYGLNPFTQYDIQDPIAAPSGVYATGLVMSVLVGTAGTTGIYPDANGTLIFDYSPQYSTTTSTPSTLSMTNGVSLYAYSGNTYQTIGTPVISSPSTINSFANLKQASTQNMYVSGLIPFGSPVYPGTSYYYSAYIGTSQLALNYSNGVVSSEFYAVGGTFTGTFITPSIFGVFELNITYYGSSYASGLVSQYDVISVVGSSYSGGHLQVFPLSSTSYEVVGYGYYLKSPTLYYTKYTGLQSGLVETLTNGAFLQQITPGSQPGGSYSVFTELTNASNTYFVYSSYTVSASMTLSSSSGSIGSTPTLTIKALAPNTYYDVLFDGSYNTNFVTDSTGTPTTTPTVTVPAVPAGTYYINVSTKSSGTVVLSQKYTVKSNSGLSLSTDSQYAFPTQMVGFTVSTTGFSPGPSPSPGTGGSQTLIGTYALVYLNSTFFAQVPATWTSGSPGTLSGSFQMPNDNIGSFWSVSIGAVDEYMVTSVNTGTTYSNAYVPYTETVGSNFLGLAEGNGAFLTGISNGQMATLEASVSNSVTTAMRIPLSDLNASIASLNGLNVTISTSFGTMTASLSAINARIANVSSGVATVTTDVGQIRTNLTSLGAVVIALNNDTAKISTDVGIFNTTINNINATVTISSGNLATIKTDLGTFTGNVTSVSNGIATIQTSLGTIKTNTNQIVPTYGTSFLLEILILILVVVAVVFSALAMMNTRKKF